MIESILDFLREQDLEVANSISLELERQRRNIELIASENIVSEAVMAAMATVTTNKYAEGYPGKRYYGGCEFVDITETLAIERAKELFGANYANVQPHSGSQANMAVYFSMLNYDDKVMGMGLDQGGHLTHGSPVNISGKYFNFTPYFVDENGFINYEDVLKIAKKSKPKMIVAGASAYSRIINFEKMREIADTVGAYLMVDMAHIAGLVAADQHPSPVPHAHVVTSTTHKTLRGPRGGLILTNDAKIAKKIDSAIFPGIQGGPLMNIIAAKAVSFKEALEPSFVTYQKQVVLNAKALSEELANLGYNIISGGTDNHLVLIDLRNKNTTGKATEVNLDKVNITINKNAIPNDPQSPFITSGIRLGTPAITSRGMKEEHVRIIANLINLTITDFDKYSDTVVDSVKKLTDQFSIY